MAKAAPRSRLERPGDEVLASTPTGDMVRISGARFLMGSDRHYPEEAPAHPVTVDSFWIDAHPVTNREFARFVRKTGHVTVAERPPDRADYPDADPALLVPASSVFVRPDRRVDLRNPYDWWTYVPSADWRHPQGPGSSIRARPDHPVVAPLRAELLPPLPARSPDGAGGRHLDQPPRFPPRAARLSDGRRGGVEGDRDPAGSCGWQVRAAVGESARCRSGYLDHSRFARTTAPWPTCRAPGCARC